MDHYGLPHGAKGIEGDDFAVTFGDDKIVFVQKSAGRGKHYTLEAGFRSGVIDLHETRPEVEGEEKYRTIVAMRCDSLPALLHEMAAIVPDLLGLLRPLRLGWLQHRGIGIARGIDPVSESDIAAVTRKHKRRLTLDPGLYERNVFVPEFLEEIYDFPDGNFSLFRRRRNIGIGFKKTDVNRNVRLFWIKRRDLMHFGNRWQPRIAAAFSRFSIPPGGNPEFPFLRHHAS